MAGIRKAFFLQDNNGWLRHVTLQLELGVKQ